MAKHRHSHIVARSHLREWAHEGKVGVGWIDRDGPELLPPAEIAVRRGFYREQHPDGSTSDVLDPAMSRVEGAAIEIIRDLENRWPLDPSARSCLAEYMALQILRSPAWREWYSQAIGVATDKIRATDPERKPHVLRGAAALMELDTARHDLLVGNVPRIGTLLANMRWTILRCGKPRLATSDHPVVPVPFSAERLMPMAAFPPQGLMYTSEIRFALSPRLLLLLTWADDFAPEQIVKMSHAQVRNHNGSVIALAEKQWFHHPLHAVEQLHGLCEPFCFTLHGPNHLPQTKRWACVKQTVDQMVEDDEEAKAIALIEWDRVKSAA
ncbi:MAG: DUF4238 domain-containing protein [Thermoleophilaceae bacterium]